MFGLIKKIFIGLLTGIVSASNHKKGVPLRNLECMTQPTLTTLHPNEYSQEIHYYPFAVKLDRCVGSCNNLNDLSDKVCVQHNYSYVNVDLIEKNVIQINGGIMINVRVSVKKAMYVKKIMF